MKGKIYYITPCGFGAFGCGILPETLLSYSLFCPDGYLFIDADGIDGFTPEEFKDGLINLHIPKCPRCGQSHSLITSVKPERYGAAKDDKDSDLKIFEGVEMNVTIM